MTEGVVFQEREEQGGEKEEERKWEDAESMSV